MKIVIILLIIFIWNLIIIINKKKKNIKIEKIEYFNLGSSHSLCAFENNSKSIINLAENSQTFFYDYKILNYYYDIIEKNGICFITISYFSFNSKEFWLKIDLVKYYKILNLNDFNGKFKLQCFVYKYIPIIWSILKKYIKIKDIDELKRLEEHVIKLKEEKM